MSSDNRLTTNNSELERVLDLVLDALTSPQSRRAYAHNLRDFINWYTAAGSPGLTKATVQHYRAELLSRGRAPATVNRALSAVRKLAREAADNALLEQVHANGIARVPGIKAHGTRSGNWLTRAEAQALLDAPDVTTLKGLRDRAILAVMLGAGLRRAEVAALTFDHLQQREGRWAIVDLVGKHGRVRSVPIPSWTKAAIDAWAAAGIAAGRVFRSLHQAEHARGDSLTPQAVRDVVAHYSQQLGYRVAAHDLRRTYAKLAHKGGAGLDQIQLSLGHASMATTERYLNVEQDFTDAPGDRLGLRLKGEGRRPKGR